MNRYAKPLKIVGLLFVLFCSGCAERRAIVKDTFLLDVNRLKTSAMQVSDGILAVQPFSVAPAFDGKGLVYRIGDNQYESDYYNEYVVSPASMVTEQTRNWLAASGVFAEVLPPVSSVSPTHILEGHVKQMAADLSEESDPKAVLEISFFLIEQGKRNREIRFHRTYFAEYPLENKIASACISALNRCLSEILEKLEKDLASTRADK